MAIDPAIDPNTQNETSEQRSERASGIGRDEAWATNMKRMYDEFLSESLESIRRSRLAFDTQLAELRAHTMRVMTDAQGYDGQRQVIALQTLQISVQALQNAVETANMIGKQGVAHRDIAINAQWSKAGDVQTMTDAIDAAVAKAVQGHMASVPKA